MKAATNTLQPSPGGGLPGEGLSLSIAVALGLVALTALAAFASYWTVGPMQERTGCLGLIEIDEKTVGLRPVDGDEPLLFTSSMTRPEVIYQVKSRYGERLRLEGTAVVEAVIDKQGRVTNVRVLRRPPLGSDWAVVKAIEQWRFKPATLANKPVKVYYTMTVNFRIER
jgi:TonB family protein